MAVEPVDGSFACSSNALIGLVRVSTDKQNTRRQHDALDPICLKVFEEKISGKLNTHDRPALLDALSHIRDGDMLTVQEVDRLGRNLLEGVLLPKLSSAAK
ncbi:recombinase family protein [Actinoallomurus sp. NPDC050550]|uniref:recombinase family protein n=1 Tax=Actinoallomurus sp. NPDC050550 TaxID=3154937 RepID=UPI0033F631B9